MHGPEVLGAAQAWLEAAHAACDHPSYRRAAPPRQHGATKRRKSVSQAFTTLLSPAKRAAFSPPPLFLAFRTPSGSPGPRPNTFRIDRICSSFVLGAALGRALVIGTVCLVNPVVEELVYRGLLVHQYALLSGNLPLALIVGAAVNALNHAYQGWRAAPFHLLFYAAAVGLLYSPYGLTAAIALHYVADAVPLFGLGEKLRNYRKSRKLAQRAARAPVQTRS